MSIKHKATLAIVLRSVRASPMVRKWVTSRERITRAPVLISSQATNSANLIGSICCINALTESTTNAVSYSLILVESYNHYKLIIIIKLNIVYYTLNMLFNEQIGKVHNYTLHFLFTSCDISLNICSRTNKHFWLPICFIFAWMQLHWLISTLQFYYIPIKD